MAAKAKAVFRPDTGRLPTLDDLSLGNRSTKYNDLTWAKACAAKRKFDAATGWQKLVPTLTIAYGADPHAPMRRMDWPDPCAPNAVKQALACAALSTVGFVLWQCSTSSRRPPATSRASTGTDPRS